MLLITPLRRVMFAINSTTTSHQYTHSWVVPRIAEKRLYRVQRCVFHTVVKFSFPKVNYTQFLADIGKVVGDTFRQTDSQV